MMTLHAMSPTGSAAAPEGGSACGPNAPPAFGSLVMGAGAGQPPARRNARKFPLIQPLRRSKHEKSSLGGLILQGSADRLRAGTTEPETILYGRHFLFDKACKSRTMGPEPSLQINGGRLERTRPAIPPLPKDYHVHRPSSLHPLTFSKSIHAGQPFTPGPKVTYPNYNLLPVKDNQETHGYPDPMAGASRSFIRRMSQLSSLEGETVRQEKLNRMIKARKPPF